MGQWFNGAVNLATIARKTGYPVSEVSGWKTRGHGPMGNTVKPIVCHHTAGPEPERTESDYPSMRVVRDGRTGLPGPLAQYGIGFSGRIYVIAAGLSYHAGTGSWRGWSGNSVALGIEAEDGGDGDWTAAQLDVYPRLCAVICQFLGVGSAWVCGHKEWAPGRKIDPAGIDMNDFRSKVSYYLNNPSKIAKTGTTTPTPTPTKDWFDMATEAQLEALFKKYVNPIPDKVWAEPIADVTKPKIRNKAGKLVYQTMAARSFFSWGRRDTRTLYDALPKLLDDESTLTKAIDAAVQKADSTDPTALKDALVAALLEVLEKSAAEDETEPVTA